MAIEQFSQRYAQDSVEWHHITRGPEFDELAEGYTLDYEYSVLGYDIDSGRLDMLMRFKPNGGHCERHRHVASTTTLILAGEQHLSEPQPDGSLRNLVRKTGDYALAPADAHAHMECGGADGCTLLLSLHAPAGVLFEVLDKDFKTLANVSIEDFVARWNSR